MVFDIELGDEVYYELDRIVDLVKVDFKQQIINKIQHEEITAIRTAAYKEGYDRGRERGIEEGYEEGCAFSKLRDQLKDPETYRHGIDGPIISDAPIKGNKE